MKFTFKPAPKAFGETPVMRTIDVQIDIDKETGLIDARVNDRSLTLATMAHGIAFAIKQRLANSYVNAATAKNEAGGLLPVSERLALWQSSFDKVLDKIMAHDVAPNWESVFSETRSAESADPVGAEVSKIVRAKLVAWAAKKGKKLPKADTPEYAALKAAMLEKQGAAIRATAESIVAARNAASEDDFDLDDESLPGDESDDDESDNVPNV